LTSPVQRGQKHVTITSIHKVLPMMLRAQPMLRRSKTQGNSPRLTAHLPCAKHSLLLHAACLLHATHAAPASRFQPTPPRCSPARAPKWPTTRLRRRTLARRHSALIYLRGREMMA
jgi:hypothetical protein